jgi:hypothetical protein
MNPPNNFDKMLKKRGYSKEAIKKMWKWYDFSEKNGVASF